MDTHNPIAPSQPQPGVAVKHPAGRGNRRPVRAVADHVGDVPTSGVIHRNSRHTRDFTVVGNHLGRHRQLSLLAMGLALHIQSSAPGRPVTIKSLAAAFPEGAKRIADALWELETAGYLERPVVRLPNGRLVTRTISINQPVEAIGRGARSRGAISRAPQQRNAQEDFAEESVVEQPMVEEPAVETTVVEQAAAETPAEEPRERPAPRPKSALLAVPRPAFPAAALLDAALGVLATLRQRDPRLLFSEAETAHLAPGVAAWLERDVPAESVSLALSADLPIQGMRRPASLVAYRLGEQLPPAPPFRAPAAASAVRHPLQNCEGCDRAFRAPTPGRCGECGGDRR